MGLYDLCCMIYKLGITLLVGEEEYFRGISNIHLLTEQVSRLNPVLQLQLPESVTLGPASKTGRRFLLIGIVHGDRPYRIKRVSGDANGKPQL
jgi:hypothetical protein